MKAIRASALAVLFSAALAAAAQERSPFLLNAILTDWGSDVGVGYRGAPLFPGVDTIFWAWGGGSIESMSFYRTTGGSLITGAAPPAGVHAKKTVCPMSAEAREAKTLALRGTSAGVALTSADLGPTPTALPAPTC